jgi:hypothetical protein
MRSRPVPSPSAQICASTVSTPWPTEAAPVIPSIVPSPPSVMRDVAVAAMRHKGLDPDNDPVTRTDFVRRVTLQLNDLVRKERVDKVGRGRAIRWKIRS